MNYSWISWNGFTYLCTTLWLRTFVLRFLKLYINNNNTHIKRIIRPRRFVTRKQINSNQMKKRQAVVFRHPLHGGDSQSLPGNDEASKAFHSFIRRP